MSAILIFVAGLGVGILAGFALAAGRRRAAERDALIGVPRRPAREAPLLAEEIDADIRELAARGKTIAAIKRLRERTGMGLKQAKETIDRLR